MENELKPKIEEIFRRIFKDDKLEVRDEMNADDVERWDSLSHIVMIAEVEKAFNIKFKLKELTKMKNVGDMIALIVKK